MILRLFRGTPTVLPERLYEQIVAQARQPWLYSVAGVPDSLEGRFDMIVLHAFLIIDRLRQEGDEGKAMAQSVFDLMFKDMDQSLREMGASDVGVGSKVRRMAEIFYGRARVYAEALQFEGGTGRQALISGLARNVFAGEAQADPALLADYVLAEHHRLAARSIDELMAGQTGFAPTAALDPA